MFRCLLCLLGFLAVFLLHAGEIYIFQTTDLHGIVHNTRESAGAPAVLAALSSDAERIGREKSLLIDCGDLLQGSLESAEDQGAAMIRLLNAAKFDVWVLGNHDFEFGSQILSRRIRDFKGSVLAGNLAFPNVKPFRIFQKNGYKIAVVGMTNPHLGQWLFQNGKQGFPVVPVESAYRKILRTLWKEKPDLILLAIHSGMYPSKRLGDEGLFVFARRHPEIVAILGGHTHEKVICKALHKGGSMYFQAGAHGGGYLRIRLKFHDLTRKLENISGEFIPVSAKNIKLPAEFRVQRKYHPIVCRNFPVRLPEQKIAAVFARSVMKALPEIQGVFHGSLTTFRPQNPVLNRIHLFQLCPFENKVVTAQINKAEFDAIMKEQNASGKYGMKQYFYSRVPGKNLWKDQPEKRLCFAFNSYSAAGAGGRFPVLKSILSAPEAGAILTDNRVFDLLENYVKETYQ